MLKNCKHPWFIKLAIIALALLFLAFASILTFGSLGGCCGMAPTVHVLNFQPSEQDKAYFGKAYWVKAGSDFAMERNYSKALIALNQGIGDLKDIRRGELCGKTQKRCIVYMVFARYLRAKVCAVLNKTETAVTDLLWLHKNGFLEPLSKDFKFWENPEFDSLKGNRDFQFLVRTYRK